MSGGVQGLQVHRDFQRHTAQRGRTARRHSQTDKTAREQRQEEATPRGEEIARLKDFVVVKHRTRDPVQNVSDRWQIQIL